MDRNEVIKEKESLIKELQNVNERLLNATTKYKELQNSLLINTDFADVLNSKRPTVDEKKAYVSLNTQSLRIERDMAIYDKEVILQKIRLCEDKLGVLNG